MKISVKSVNLVLKIKILNAKHCNLVVEITTKIIKKSLMKSETIERNDLLIHTNFENRY